MTPFKLSELEEKVKAATPGPWVYDSYGYIIAENGPLAEVRGASADYPLDRNGEFIAAANPQTILKLLAMLKVYEEALKKIEYAWDDVPRLNNFCAEALAAVRKPEEE